MRDLTRLRIVFLITVTAIAILMQFNCTKPCEAQFSTRRWLVRHRNGCPTYKTAAALRTEHRRYGNASTDARGSNRKRHLDADEQTISDLDNVRVCVACESPITLVNGTR